MCKNYCIITKEVWYGILNTKSLFFRRGHINLMVLNQSTSSSSVSKLLLVLKCLNLLLEEFSKKKKKNLLLEDNKLCLYYVVWSEMLLDKDGDECAENQEPLCSKIGWRY